MKKIIIISVIVIVIGGLAYLIFGNSNSQENGLKLVEVAKGNIVDKALAVGQLEPRQEIQVKSKISGIVKTLHVDIGHDVKAGDPLLTVAPNPTPLEYAEAKRYLELARVDYNNSKKIFQRNKEMYEKNLISREEFDINEAQYHESELRLQLSEEKFELLQKGTTGNGKSENTIVSPINGTVLEKLVNEGDPVVPLTSYQAGTPLLTLAPMDELIFKGTVDEIDVGKLSEGMTAELKVGALPDAKLIGSLSKISPKARKQDNTTLFDIEIEINDIGELTLRAGYSANADVIINKKDSILVIPERLLTFKGDSTFVEVQDSAGIIDTVDVIIGLSDGLNIEIIEGLALGDNVVERPPKEIE
ncbi:MAG: efflux RND transporter periplasmic adaptor subunit [candidate division Zixibacteria bacterium]|nr:efflux RND transporter periplasmic adaptor subunit [candidate division Zixibacteria bacterium]